MVKFAAGVAAFLLAASAFASCPPSAPYRCYQGANGKQVCGCG